MNIKKNCDIKEKDKLWNASLNMKSNSTHILFENNNNENIEDEIIKRENKKKLRKSVRIFKSKD